MDSTYSGLWQRYLQFLNQPDPGGVRALFTENARFQDNAAQSLGVSGTCSGHAEIQDFFVKLFAHHQVAANGILQFGTQEFYDVCIDSAALLRCAGCIERSGDRISTLTIRLRL